MKFSVNFSLVVSVFIQLHLHWSFLINWNKVFCHNLKQYIIEEDIFLHRSHGGLILKLLKWWKTAHVWGNIILTRKTRRESEADQESVSGRGSGLKPLCTPCVAHPARRRWGGSERSEAALGRWRGHRCGWARTRSGGPRLTADGKQSTRFKLAAARADTLGGEESAASPDGSPGSPWRWGRRRTPAPPRWPPSRSRPGSAVGTNTHSAERPPHWSAAAL